MSWPLVAHMSVVVALAGAMIVVSWFLGERQRGRATGEPYEAGIVSTGGVRGRLTVRFYVVALLFVIFDLEVAFLFGWAIAAEEVGWSGYLGLLVFVALLAVGLIYEWRQGALDWGRTDRAAHRAQAAELSSRRPPETLEGGP